MRAPRLHLPEPLAVGTRHGLDQARTHYLTVVLRCRPGDRVRLFNAEAGEWEAAVCELARRALTLEVTRPLRAPQPEPGPVLVFAPFRRHRLEWMIEKAVELGAAGLQPVLTERTVVRLERPERLRALLVEAAEQCERLSVPTMAATIPLGEWLASRPPARPALVLDETGGGRPLADRLPPAGEFDLLVGPEGGWTPGELGRLGAAPGVVAVGLGPRVLRAETAALAALAIAMAASSARR